MQNQTSLQPIVQKCRPIELPWPCFCDGQNLYVFASAPGGRCQSMGHFFGASFLAFGLLLLIVGTHKNLSPVFAGGVACILSGLMLLCAIRFNHTPFLILNRTDNLAVLCKRHLGRRVFRIFQLASLEISTNTNDNAVNVRPAANNGSGREIPGLPSGISNKKWQQGMVLHTEPGLSRQAALALQQWLQLGYNEECTPLLAESLDADEFKIIMGKSLPPALVRSLSGLSWNDLQARDIAENVKYRSDYTQHSSSPEHPSIRRAPDLRDNSFSRDKRN